jgi:hypothetical protein
MPDSIKAFFWHHDATPVGETPGGLGWMIDSYVKGLPCAQIWIDIRGVWHFVGAGYASHAGVVKGGLTSANSVGAETDHTINETYPTVQLDSIRKGVAVCAIQEGRNADFLTFHKIEASPYGRKVDPWFDGQSNDLNKWGAELTRERNIVQNFINQIRGGGITPPVTGDDELSAAEVEKIVGEIAALKNLLIEPQYQTGGHTYRTEIQWSFENQIKPELEEIKRQLSQLERNTGNAEAWRSTDIGGVGAAQALTQIADRVLAIYLKVGAEGKA